MAPVTPFGDGGLVEIRMSLPAESGVAGRYFLARCGAQTERERLTNWHFSLRKPLFAVRSRPVDDDSSLWQLYLPAGHDPAYGWLRDRRGDESINLLGPLGLAAVLAPETRNLLLIADAPRVMKIVALADPILDRGGRVTVILLEESADRIRGSLLAQLPIAAEVHFVSDTAAWTEEIEPMIRWADQLGAALPDPRLPQLARAVNNSRIRQEEGFALIYPDSDLVCGSGACLACVVPAAGGGLTRTCVHGPMLDLRRLAANAA